MAGELRQRDLQLVREQLGREPTTPFSVVVRCAPDGHPLVIRNDAVDADGAPFPTTFWLTCPTAHKLIAQVESEGAIGEWNARIDADPELAAAVEAAHRAHATERARLGPAGSEEWGGVGGTRTGVKCLHAHYANHLAGGEDPIGAWTAARIEPVHRPACADRFAVMDQGTNSTRLLLVEPLEDGTLLELARDMVITRLGKGVDASGHLAPEAVERTLSVIDTFTRRARAMQARRIRVSATSAVRDAADRTGFAEGVAAATGEELRVIDGEHEARLSFLGATRGLEDVLRSWPEPWLVLDIGGGSTEFIVGGHDTPTAGYSTQMGSVRLTERFIRSDPPAPEELAAVGEEIDARIDEAFAAVPALTRAARGVAVAGTATTVTAISLGLQRYDPDAIHGATLTLEEATAVRDRLASMTTPERAALPVMAPGRADVITVGATILVRVMERSGVREALVSEEDILDGLAVELFEDG